MTDTPALPTIADYRALTDHDATDEGRLHTQVVAHIAGTLAAEDNAAPGVLERMTRAAGDLEEELLETFAEYPEVLARVLVTHLIDDHMAATGRRKRSA